MAVSGILLDIEGTTTPISFVYGTLFPYARARMESFVTQHRDEPAVRNALQLLESERAGSSAAATMAEVANYALGLMDQDRKSTGLKELQGQIWQEGYRVGELRGVVFPDVPPALEAWRLNGQDVRIFSSGSVLAQQLLFSTTEEGDLTRFLNGYFDTTAGSKTEPASYAEIAASFARAPETILFISDVTRELDAARLAGLQTRLCVRPGNPAQPDNSHPSISSFDELDRPSPQE